MPNIRRFHPGVYLKDSLDAMEMTNAEFSARTGISERTLSALINGKNDITFEIAYNLSAYFGTSINYWTNLQNQYDLYLKEATEIEKIKEDWELIKKNSLKKYLLECKYISEDDSFEIIVKKAREYVGVNSLSLLSRKDTFVCFKEQHTAKESDSFVQNFWISLALREARKKNGISYNKEKLLEYIPLIRNMTIMDPSDFYPQLTAMLEECGISFVLLPYLPKSNIYGATKWFSRENVMLAISNRGGKADLFWFTLFHEISHVLMEHRRETLINGKGFEDQIADEMASNMLIEQSKWKEFVLNGNFTVNSIREFADKNRILPCIVLGRLHNEKLVPYGTYDKCFSIYYKITIN